MKGSPRTRDGLSLIAEKVMALDELHGLARKWLRLRVLDDGASSKGRLRDIYRELKGHPGEAGVLLEVPLEGVKALLKVRDVCRPSADLFLGPSYRAVASKWYKIMVVLEAPGGEHGRGGRKISLRCFLISSW